MTLGAHPSPPEDFRVIGHSWERRTLGDISKFSRDALSTLLNVKINKDSHWQLLQWIEHGGIA